MIILGSRSGSKRNNTPETLEKLSKIEEEVDHKVDEILKRRATYVRVLPLYWGTKKRLLKEEYGIDWLTPAEYNPGVRFD